MLADTYRGVGRMAEAEITESEIVTRREHAQREQEVRDETEIVFEWERQD
jgi:hypothetical protein